jgi:hypothetical protein
MRIVKVAADNDESCVTLRKQAADQNGAGGQVTEIFSRYYYRLTLIGLSEYAAIRAATCSFLALRSH